MNFEICKIYTVSYLKYCLIAQAPGVISDLSSPKQLSWPVFPILYFKYNKAKYRNIFWSFS